MENDEYTSEVETQADPELSMTPPTTAVLVPKVIREEHETITHEFIRRVAKMLAKNPQLKAYSVEEAWQETESARLQIDDKTTLTLLLTKSK